MRWSVLFELELRNVRSTKYIETQLVFCSPHHYPSKQLELLHLVPLENKWDLKNISAITLMIVMMVTFKGYHNSVFGLASRQLLESQLFHETLKNASAINNRPNYPVSLFSLKRDSVVSVNNTENYIAKYGKDKIHHYFFDNSLHKVNIDGGIINVDHTTGQIVGNLFALSFIKNMTNSSEKNV